MTPPHFAWQVCGTWRHRARRFTWQAWYLATSTCVLRGRRGTSGTGLALVARFAWQLRFAWQRWHLWHWAGSGGALGPCWSPGATRHFAWQAWHLATSTVTLWQARHLATSTFVLRGRRGTSGTGLGLVARLIAVRRRGTLHGRHGTW